MGYQWAPNGAKGPMGVLDYDSFLGVERVRPTKRPMISGIGLAIKLVITISEFIVRRDLMEKTVGIIGGMGPVATNDLYRKIIENTEANNDCEHLHVIIDSNTKIPDRTSFIINGGEDPSKALVRSALKLEYMGADFIIMPCNTAHYFIDEIKKYAEIPVLNIIKATAEYIQSEHIKKPLLLATEGTYKTGIYKTIFEKEGMAILYPNRNEKTIINEAIYKVKSNDFSGYESLIEIINNHRDEGIDGIILGCTELPVLFKDKIIDISLVDPTLALAKAAIYYSQH